MRWPDRNHDRGRPRSHPTLSDGPSVSAVRWATILLWISVLLMAAAILAPFGGEQ